MYLPRSRALALISLAVLDGPAMVDSFQPFEAGVQLNFSEDTVGAAGLGRESGTGGEAGGSYWPRVQAGAVDAGAGEREGGATSGAPATFSGAWQWITTSLPT